MGQQIDLATTQKPVRDFIRRLGKVREPVEATVPLSILSFDFRFSILRP
jgi:hypothetical protein